MPADPIFQGGGLVPPSNNKSKTTKNDGDSVSSSSDHITAFTAEDSHDGNHHHAASKDSEVDKLAAGESMAARRSIIFVLAALALAAGVGTLIYFLMSNEEWSTCQANFKSYSNEVAKNSDANVAAIFSHVGAIAAAITSGAVGYNQTFPNVTLPNFDERVKAMGQDTVIPIVLFAPMVRDSDRKGWEAYAATQDWIDQDLKYDVGASGIDRGSVHSRIFSYADNSDDDKVLQGDDGILHGMKFPLWQVGPVPRNASIVKMDLLTNPSFHDTIVASMYEKQNVLSDVKDLGFLYESLGLPASDTPHSTAAVPVKEDFYQDSPVVGFVFGSLPWSGLFKGVVPAGTQGVVAVVNDKCGKAFAFLINGENAKFLGYGSAENFTETASSRYSDTHAIADFVRSDKYANGTLRADRLEGCDISLTLYSTKAYEASCTTNMPAVYTSVVVLVFVLAIALFAGYDFWVSRRQQKIIAEAKRADAIVSSLFPKHVQERMMEEARAQGELGGKGNWKGKSGHPNDAFASQMGAHGTGHIADLYAEATIMFADIVGFTQWASCRVPSEVFSLLEAVFAAFDEIAHHRGVYKVETVGDCYVAACGVPEPRKEHALVMGRFARDCLVAFNNVVKQLETELGPDTGELGIRVGIHSGPVTAGVLRGERSRFQLFGDTMNTCSRIESTGDRNKIHMSQETAELLMAHGKGHWCRKREDAVVAKGKGVLSTFWLEAKGDAARSTHSSSQGTDEQNEALLTLATPIVENHKDTSLLKDGISEKTLRLARWNADILAKKLCKVVARREALRVRPAPKALMSKLERNILERTTMTLDEVKDVVMVPKCEAKIAMMERQDPTVDLGPSVIEQLKSYLMTIAHLYRDNAFHGFEHASHVTMSVVKLFHRVIETDHGTQAGPTEEEFVDNTYGLASDPLTRFSVVFAALIHDVDHKGVPNVQLTKENDPIAAAYNHQSPAEQNSIDIAWSLLMQEEYEDLRAAIYTTPRELAQFRQILVNAVMATDIMDKNLSAARKERWIKAFSEQATIVAESEGEDDVRNRKATVVLEHLIQASDVAHTMQHWNIYRKWNTLFFEESYKAYLEGRSEKNPADTWYDGELGFFDYYIIPLAMKLKECGVFGVSGDEYMVYAVRNRKEWENVGRELVEEMVNAAQIKFNTTLSRTAI